MTTVKILLVEDEVIIATLQKKLLKEYGYDVTLVSSGEKAVSAALAEDSHFDIVLMDINLGNGIDGTEAAEQILGQKDLPLVFLSSHTEREVVEKTEKITSYGYVVKNSGITVLDTSIKMALRLHNARMMERIKDQALTESKQRYRRALEGSNDGLWEYSFVKGEFYCSDRFCNMLGYSRQDFPGTSVFLRSLIHPEDRKSFEESLSSLLAGETERYEGIFRMKTRDGSYIHTLGRGSLTWGEDNTLLHFTGFITDITKGMETENLHRESEERYKTIFNNIAEGVLVTDSATMNIICVNPAACTLLGYSEDEYKSLAFKDLHREKDMEFILNDMMKHKGGFKKRSQGIPFVRKDREVIYCDISSGKATVDGHDYIVGFLTDVTERRNLHNQLILEHNLFTQGPVSTIIVLPRNGWPVKYVSENIIQILGYTRQEVLSEDFLYSEIINPDDSVRLEATIREKLEEGKNEFEQSYRVRHRDGRYIWIYNFIKFFTDELSGLKEIHAYMFEQTEFKTNEFTCRAVESGF